MANEPFKCLTIGGSDSGGAAGAQADLKTWTALGVHGMSVLTLVTAQNSAKVAGAIWLDPAFVQLQLATVLEDYGAQGLKTGMIGNVALVETIAATLNQYEHGPVVIDPVLVGHDGKELFSAEITNAYKTHLLPIADLITPNWDEAALLAQMSIATLDDVKAAATAIHQAGCKAVLVTGWEEDDVVFDVLVSAETTQVFKQPRITTQNTHGSGDSLSASIAAYLAAGFDLVTAIEKSRLFVEAALARSANWTLGAGHGPLGHFDTILAPATQLK